MVLVDPLTKFMRGCYPCGYAYDMYHRPVSDDELVGADERMLLLLQLRLLRPDDDEPAMDSSPAFTLTRRRVSRAKTSFFLNML